VRFRTSYQIAVTYQCKLKCEHCFELFDVLPSLDRDSEVSLTDVVFAGRLLKKFQIDVAKLRLTGGEPMLHPKLSQIQEVVKGEWKPETMVVCTSGVGFSQEELSQAGSVREYGMELKRETHHNYRISPFDLGIAPKLGFVDRCRTQHYCGCYFDAYGFTACPQAAPFGRLFGMDYHEWAPVLRGREEFCRHCTASLGRNGAARLMQLARDGKIEYPTKTFKEAIARRKDEGYLEIPKFRDRLPKQMQQQYDKTKRRIG